MRRRDLLEGEVVDQKLREVNYMRRKYACSHRRDRRGNAGGTNGAALEDTKSPGREEKTQWSRGCSEVGGKMGEN